MHNSEDQRKNTGMEDSTAMTIEFLRARLLSERSVSRTARQRADELAHRVLELEEQLKIVSLQRNKAEKATSDVLAILENHAISDVSREFDSSSDQEGTHSDSNVGNGSTKEEEGSINSKSRRNDTDRISSSELEYSPSSGSRLSWKGSKDSSHSVEKKYLDSSIRRRRSFTSTSSSPKHNLGKSCRQIRRRETRSAVEELKVACTMLDAQDNGVASSSEGFPNCFGSGPEILREGYEFREEEVLPEGQDSDSLENQKKATNSNHYLNRHGRDRDMERALEHQAQLIGRYEAEEKAQRDWEEKFKENNSSTPDSCEPGNHSDVTEERDEIKPHHSDVTEERDAIKPQAQSSGGTHTSQDQERKDKNGSSLLTYESPAQDFAFPKAKENVNREYLESESYPLPHGFHQHWHSHVSPGDHFTQVADHSTHAAFHSVHGAQVLDHFIHDANHSEHKADYSEHVTDHSENVASHSAHIPLTSQVENQEESLGSQNKHYALVPQETSNQLGGVLDALQQAKSLLQHKLNRLPLIEGGSVGKAVEPSFPSTRGWDRVEIPVDCTGLFRVPSDFEFGTATQADYLGPDSQLSSKNYYPDSSFMMNSGNQFLTSPYLKTGSGPSVDNRFLTSPYRESGSRIPPPRPSFDSYLDTGLSSSTRYTYPAYPSYPDPLSRMPFNEGFTRSFPSREVEMPSNDGFQSPLRNREVGMPSTDHLSFYNDHIRPNMYR